MTSQMHLDLADPEHRHTASPSGGASSASTPTADRGADARRRVPLGRLYADAVTFPEAVRLITERAHDRLGGFVVTPNVDHVCLAETEPELIAAYDAAALSLVDGKPLMWMAGSCATPLPEKISGSDLVVPLLEKAGEKGMSVFIVAADRALCERTVALLLQWCPGLRIAGYDWPMYEPAGDDTALVETFANVCSSEADILLLGMGSPKQEYAMYRYADVYAPTLAVGVGASFEFLVGDKSRAPRWVSEAGLEWVYRMLSEPRRLGHRYLVRDRAIASIWFRARRAARAGSGPYARTP